MSAWMNCSGLPPVGMVRAVVSTLPPPRIKRLKMASPIPLVPPVTRIRLPVNSLASYGMFDAPIGNLLVFIPTAVRMDQEATNIDFIGPVSTACRFVLLLPYWAPCAFHGPTPAKWVGV